MDHHGGLEMECYGDLFQCHPEHQVSRGDVLGVEFCSENTPGILAKLPGPKVYYIEQRQILFCPWATWKVRLQTSKS